MAVKIEEHGVSVAIKRQKKRLFMEMRLFGKLTHEDYKVFVPLVDKAFREAKGLEVDILVDMRDFRGWKPRAAWDDMVFGMKLRKAFDKMAVVGDKKWEEVSVRMMSHLVKGKMKFFKNRRRALEWLLK